MNERDAEEKPQCIDIDISLCLSSEISNIIFGKEVEKVLRETCLDIEKRYEIKFIEIGAQTETTCIF
jgi:hypothetical protein